MILVRNVLQIDPARMKSVQEAARKMMPIIKKMNFPVGRMMTDLVGEYYTLVIEIEAPDLATFESGQAEAFANAEWQKFYGEIRGAVRGGRREIFTVISS